MNASATAQSTVTPAPDETGAVTHAKITSTQKKQWEDTMSMMVWTAPGFQHILYKLLNAQNNTPSEYVAIMAQEAGVAMTDGRNIIVNPDTFFEMSLPERVYVTAHEVIHNVYGDVEFLHRCVQSNSVPMNDGTSRKFNNATMQKAMDARINALLDESRIGKAPKMTAKLRAALETIPGVDMAAMPAAGEPFGHFDKDVKGADSVLDIYGKYYDDEFPDDDGDQQGGPGGGNNPGGFDSLTKPGSASGTPPTPRNPGQWAVEIAAAQTIEQSRSQGKMGAALKRMFQQILEPEVPWVDHIETLINRQVGDGGYDWTVPDPWMAIHEFFSPSPTGHGAGWIVIWGDTSGSRDDTELASNISELRGIMETVNPQRMTLIWCDADIEDGSVIEITDPADLDNLKPVGGGGTDYQPVLDWINNNGDGHPDLFIGFTDGYVSHPERDLPYPVIWASSTDHAYPFGQVVRVNKIARGV